MQEMKEYYARRAEEYEAIYNRDEPTRQIGQLGIGIALGLYLRNRDVIEVAAGTGYWTQFASDTARSVTATDINAEVLDVARKSKNFSNPVYLVQADAFRLPFSDSKFDGGLANFWFSHLRKNQVGNFLTHFHSKLQPGSPVFMADNVYNEGVGGELVTFPDDENTYKIRTLADGSSSTIIKNYPTDEELVGTFSRYNPNFNKANIHRGQHFWYLHYTV